MNLPLKRFHALLLLLVLFPLWWIQRADATALRPQPSANFDGSDSDDDGDDGGDHDDDGDDGDDCDDDGDDGDDSDDSDDGEDSDDCDDGEDSDDCDDGEDSDDCDDGEDSDDCDDGEDSDDCDDGEDSDDCDDGEDSDDCDDDSDDCDDDSDDCDDDSDDCDDHDDCDDGEITDCNHNGIEDSLDIAAGATDADHNGIPDECEPGITSFCEGIGEENGGVDCPCGNVAPDGTSEGCLNGSGVGALLTATGIPSVSNDTLVLHVDGIPNGKPGFFFQGAADAGSGPFGNGTRCIGGPFIRLDKIAGQPGGNSYPNPGDPPISEEFNIPAGATRYYQVLYRDGQGPCGGTTNTSNGLKVVWGL